MPGDTSLRPYYDADTFNAGYHVIYKPGIGLVDTATQKPIVASLSLGSKFGPGRIGLRAMADEMATSTLVRSSDKNYAYDLEILEYFDTNNLVELLKNLAFNFFKNYFRVLLSQPLEMVRLVLQVGYFDFSSGKSGESGLAVLSELVLSDDEDEIDYFHLSEDEQPAQVAKKFSNPAEPAKKNLNKIEPVSQHTVDIMAAIASKDGPLALFKGINALFIYHTLSHTIEAWVTGFISPFLGIPDPFFLDLTHSNDPVRSLWLSVLACVLAGLILMPLDLIKVKLMITQFNKILEDGEPSKINRSVRESIRYYPVKLLLQPPPTIALLTVLHQFSTSVFRKSAPYLMFVRFNIDSYQAPALYTSANLVLSIMELFIKLPVENLLRKEQLRFLLKPKSPQEDKFKVVTIDDPDENLIVTFNGWDTAHLLENGQQLSFFRRLRLLGLFNGWRVGVLNVIGYWWYNIFNSSGARPEERL